jgi:hypothetical protein
MDNKKAAAAMAAVMNYIKSQEEAILAQGAGPALPEKTDPQPTNSIWGMSGRQQQMQLRTLMQLKNFHGSR